MDYNEVFKERTKKLAIGVISVYSSLIRARSIKEKFAKLSIMVEEADEMLFWLEISEELGLIPSEKIEPLKKESEEIVKATTSYQKKINVK